MNVLLCYSECDTVFHHYGSARHKSRFFPTRSQPTVKFNTQSKTFSKEVYVFYCPVA